MYCPKCGIQNDDNAYHCTSCGEIIQPVTTQQVMVPTLVIDESDTLLRLCLPIGRSGLAIAAGYLGLFAVLLVPAPFALLCGILALRDIKQNPKKIGKWRAVFGIIMGALGTVGLLCLLAAILSHK